MNEQTESIYIYKYFSVFKLRILLKKEYLYLKSANNVHKIT